MRFAVLPVFALLLNALVGCVPSVACTDFLAFSVSVEVLQQDGTPIDDATVQYSVDGGSFSDCENFQDGNYACGMEEEGTLVVKAEWNGASDEMTFEIDADECHVIGQSATFTLVP